jgi:MFS family permease
MVAAAELILGAMLPVFSLQYAGFDPSIVLPNLHLPPGANGLASLKDLPGPPIWRVYLLASLPVIMMGIVNFFFVPLAISVGRRPVILGAGLIAIGGAVWAGNSTSLNSHLGARATQAIGAGTVESLLPFIIQDMVFYHQRNTAISSVFVCQGLIFVGLGIAAPYVIIHLSWRWLYFITAISAGVFLVGVFFLLPETRYHRTCGEMSKYSQCGLDEKRPLTVLQREYLQSSCRLDKIAQLWTPRNILRDPTQKILQSFMVRLNGPMASMHSGTS